MEPTGELRAGAFVCEAWRQGRAWGTSGQAEDFRMDLAVGWDPPAHCLWPSFLGGLP